MSDDPVPGRLLRGCVVIGLLFVAGMLLFTRMSLHNMQRARMESCKNNLRQLGLAFQQYVDRDKREIFPPLSDEPGRLFVTLTSMYPEFVQEPYLLLCPNSNNWPEFEREEERTPPVLGQIFDDRMYFYLPYSLRDDDDVELFARAYREAVAAGKPLVDDISFPDSPEKGVRGKLYRLRRGIERAYIGDEPGAGEAPRIRASIPVLVERVGNHPKASANVLYFDGHVETIEYPGRWPMTEKTVRILNELDALGADPEE